MQFNYNFPKDNKNNDHYISQSSWQTFLSWNPFAGGW